MPDIHINQLEFARNKPDRPYCEARQVLKRHSQYNIFINKISANQQDFHEYKI